MDVRERVEELAFELGNRIMAEDDEYRIDGARQELLDYIDEALATYGKSVYLLATKADFLLEPGECLEIYKEALEMAVAIGDHSNVFVIASDILELHTDALRDEDFVSAFASVSQYAATHGLEEHEDYVSLLEIHLTTGLPPHD